MAKHTVLLEIAIFPKLSPFFAVSAFHSANARKYWL